ncbi:precorrin-6y C5,15-methyltransferase (decarboxylating) subunit CbiE [Clostridium cylindrosporum]|uniref:Cobalamin biosynthesis bifunctional protein CbiET n=1 Tax=Clostridium cylindrosporum DSM 605 TaxID=1121307 RepID=A0A0J8DC16_CLOCY|nr:precorrin-6y C5,15-methyltransferase (decarboxylating) subunit CbiE [Clostridium cylindrosporum]KMT21844.1 cobalamin biosynthesis bifunctional protein CbiET [Clostridium cylindrosporum DSM 605]
MKIYIVGIGTGNKDLMTGEALKVVESSDLLIGASRMLEAFSYLETPKINSYLSKEIKGILENNKEAKKVSIIVSGDVGFFSATKKLLLELEGYDVELIPGISSIVYFASKLKANWDDMKIISLHGRDESIIASIMKNAKTFILTGGKNKVNSICKSFVDAGLDNIVVSVGENLSYDNEKITTGIPSRLQGLEFDDLSVMLVENKSPINKFNSFGIADEEFARGDVPMTKSEVRSIVMSKLRLQENDIAYDVGAGTGSVSIEMALAASEVYAIERNPKGIELINENREKFNAYNLKAIEGLAPDSLLDLPAPDKVFIGGSGKKLDEIIELCLKKNPRVRIVVTAIALETVAQTIECFKKFNIKNSEIVQVNISKARSVANYNMMIGQNPIYIFSGDGSVDEK